MNWKKNESTHHILPKSRTGLTVSNNTIELRENNHRALHIIFSNDTIQEQIQDLIDLSKRALQKEFVEKVEEILKEDELGYYYKNGVYRKS